MFEQIEQARLAVKEMAAAPVEAGLGSDVGEQLVDLLRLRSELDAVVLSRLAAFDRNNVYAADAFTSTTAWLQRRAHLAAGEAAGLVRTARTLAEALPAMQEEMAAGEITYGHARVAARAVMGVPAEQIREGQPLLADLARRYDAGRFGVLARHWRSRVDGRQLAPTDEDSPAIHPVAQGS